jgi:hypothetical protein
MWSPDAIASHGRASARSLGVLQSRSSRKWLFSETSTGFESVQDQALERLGFKSCNHASWLNPDASATDLKCAIPGNADHGMTGTIVVR